MKQIIKPILFILAFASAGDDWTDNKKAIDKSKVINNNLNLVIKKLKKVFLKKGFLVLNQFSIQGASSAPLPSDSCRRSGSMTNGEIGIVSTLPTRWRRLRTQKVIRCTRPPPVRPPIGRRNDFHGTRVNRQTDMVFSIVRRSRVRAVAQCAGP